MSKKKNEGRLRKGYKDLSFLTNSVADPGCLSKVPDPDFLPSRILDPRSNNNNKEEREKISCSHEVNKNKIILFMNRILKKLSQLTKN